MPSIIRVEHDKDRPFLMVSKDTVRDKGVSFEARGFLMFLLAKPDDWQIRPEQLAEECELHKSTVYRLLRRLMDAGYVRRDDFMRRKDGTFERSCLYTVFEDKALARKAKKQDRPTRIEGREVPF